MITTLFALAAIAAADPDPLAPARAGAAQCMMPDVLFKTCLSLEHYSPTGPGAYIDRGENLIALNQPAVVMETLVPVQIKGRAACGTLRSAHVLGGKVTIGGQPVPRNKAAAILARVSKKLAALRDKESCMAVEPTDGGMFKTKITLAGVRRPDLDVPFKWVKPSEGYTVAP